jgi:CubicO group peptidase (beta-lactamase class C family)
VAVDPAFAPVAEAFFEHHDGLPAAVCVIVDGRTVIDLVHGWDDPDTLVNAFSVGKGLTAAVLGHVFERTDLEPDDPVVQWWPEFGVAGKESVTVAELASHQAGLPAVRSELPDDAMYRWSVMTSSLAAETPWWPPGTAHGYHTNTFGFLVGEVVRRAAGASVGTLLRELAGPRDADVFIGLPDAEHRRVADFDFVTTGAALDDAPRMLRLAYGNPRGLSGVGVVNTPEWRRAEIPSTNGHASARGVARFYAGLLDGVLAPDTLARLCEPQVDGPDIVLDRPSRFGIGFQLPQPERPLGPGPRAFGHFGAGGSLGFADPDLGLGFGYVMAQMGPRWQNPRNQALLAALADCL